MTYFIVFFFVLRTQKILIMSVKNIYDLKIFVKYFSFRYETDPGPITIDINFNKEIFPVESSGTDFSDFNKGVCITLTETVEDLVAILQERPIYVVLKKFLSTEEVGSVEISWPKDFLTKLKDPNFKNVYEMNSFVITKYEKEFGDIVLYLGIKSITLDDTEVPIKEKSLISYKSIDKYDAEEILYSMENFLETNIEEDHEKYIVNNGKLYKCGVSKSHTPLLPRNLSTIKEVNELSTTLPYKCFCDSNLSKQGSVLGKSPYLRSQRPELLQRPSSLNINPEDLMRKWCSKLKEDFPRRPKTVGSLTDANEKKLKIKEKKVSQTKLEKEFKLNKICVKKLKSLEEKM